MTERKTEFLSMPEGGGGSGATAEQLAQIEQNAADIAELRAAAEPELIEHFVSTEDMDVFARSETPDGTPYDFKMLFIECDIGNGNASYATLNFNSNLKTAIKVNNAVCQGRGVSIGLWLNPTKTVCMGYAGWRNTPKMTDIYNISEPILKTFSCFQKGTQSIKSFDLNFNSTVNAGTVVKIYGVKM